MYPLVSEVGVGELRNNHTGAPGWGKNTSMMNTNQEGKDPGGRPDKPLSVGTDLSPSDSTSYESPVLEGNLTSSMELTCDKVAKTSSDPREDAGAGGIRSYGRFELDKASSVLRLRGGNNDSDETDAEGEKDQQQTDSEREKNNMLQKINADVQREVGSQKATSSTTIAADDVDMRGFSSDDSSDEAVNVLQNQIAMYQKERDEQTAIENKHVSKDSVKRFSRRMNAEYLED